MTWGLTLALIEDQDEALLPVCWYFAAAENSLHQLLARSTPSSPEAFNISVMIPDGPVAMLHLGRGIFVLQFDWWQISSVFYIHISKRQYLARHWAIYKSDSLPRMDYSVHRIWVCDMYHYPFPWWGQDKCILCFFRLSAAIASVMQDKQLLVLDGEGF